MYTVNSFYGKYWRHERESNPPTRICSPLHNRSDIAPSKDLPVKGLGAVLSMDIKTGRITGQTSGIRLFFALKPSNEQITENNPMTNFTTARINMVDSQIHTMGVVSEAVLDAYRTVPREEFVPQDRKGIAYCDEDMPIGQGRCLMEPVTHARLVQAAAPVANDTVLDVGGATGYSAAILSRLVERVVACEPDASFLSQAEQTWSKLGCNNVIPHQGDFCDGNASLAPFSLIFLNGSVESVPDALLSQMAPHGRLVAVIRKKNEKIGRAMLFVKTTSGNISERILFDAAVPYLPGHAPRTEFVF